MNWVSRARDTSELTRRRFAGQDVRIILLGKGSRHVDYCLKLDDHTTWYATSELESKVSDRGWVPIQRRQCDAKGEHVASASGRGGSPDTDTSERRHSQDSNTELVGK